MTHGRYNPNETAGILPTSYELGKLRNERKVRRLREENVYHKKKCDVTLDIEGNLLINGKTIICIPIQDMFGETQECNKRCADFEFRDDKVLLCDGVIIFEI